MRIHSMCVLASSRQRYPTSMSPFGKTQKRKIASQRRCVIHNPIHAHTAWQECPRCRHVPPHRRLSPRRNPHSCGTTAVPNPRFRALALFGRRPTERVDSLGIRRPKTCTEPALPRCKKRWGLKARHEGMTDATAGVHRWSWEHGSVPAGGARAAGRRRTAHRRALGERRG
jgi:hypothetical protein